MLHRLFSLLRLFGIDPMCTVRAFAGLPAFFRDYRLFLREQVGSKTDFEHGKLYPCVFDRYLQSGTATGHYFHQDLWVAQRIFDKNPVRHIDAGSRIDGFVAHVATFREIETIDIRGSTLSVRNIRFLQTDLMGEIPPELRGCCDSLSCLHVLEHFGLGRYGDRVDLEGHLKGLANLHCILKNGGVLYLSVPIGPQRIEFNAHRVFSVPGFLKLIQKHFTTLAFSYVNDDGEFFPHVDIRGAAADSSFGCNFGCGIFELIKQK